MVALHCGIVDAKERFQEAYATADLDSETGLLSMTNVRHAEEAGLRVEISSSISFLEPFLGIYYATMKRDHAKGYYFFARDKFQRLHDALQPNGGLQYALVFLEDRVISAALL